ncbi:urease accessory protein [Pseudorhodoplanes sinuspersici]|nr:urease accessory protein [Pseudorhodoplanes sinuspersici]
MSTRITIITVIITATTMSGRKRNLPLRKKGERQERKQSRHVYLTPCGGGRPPEPSDGGREGNIRDQAQPLATPLPNSPPQGGSELSGDRGGSAFLYRLMAWLSPSYPVGAFSYSSGIEWVVEAGDIKDAATLIDWLSLMMSNGAGFCDAVLFVHAHRATSDDNEAALRDVAELAAAFSPTKERHLETTAQGRAFIDATRAAWACESLSLLAKAWDGPVAYPVAVGVTCAGHGMTVDVALPALLHAVAANWISAGVRLIPLGQTDGQRVLAALEPVIVVTAARALTSSLDDIGSATFRADLASMRHETQYTRLFRS